MPVALLLQLFITIKTSHPLIAQLFHCASVNMYLMFSIPSLKNHGLQTSNFLVSTFKSTASLSPTCFFYSKSVLIGLISILDPWGRLLDAYPIYTLSFLNKIILVSLRKLMYPAKTPCFSAFCLDELFEKYQPTYTTMRQAHLKMSKQKDKRSLNPWCHGAAISILDCQPPVFC